MKQVEIIAVTHPVGKLSEVSIDEFISYVARVSNPGNQSNKLTARRLLKYLLKNKHWSPFEMSNVVMEFNTTRDIGRQLLRHKSLKFQEFSQRYADPIADMGMVNREARLQDTNNRQNSIDTTDDTLQKWFSAKQDDTAIRAKLIYKDAIERNIAKEQARVILPEGLTMSRLYVNGDVRSWIHYCDVRMKASTQKEHRLLAEMAWTELLSYYPSLELIEPGKGHSKTISDILSLLPLATPKHIYDQISNKLDEMNV